MQIYSFVRSLQHNFRRFIQDIFLPLFHTITRRLKPYVGAEEPRKSRPTITSIGWILFALLYIGALIWIMIVVQAPGTVVSEQVRRYHPLMKQSCAVLAVFPFLLYYLLFRRTYSAAQLCRVQAFSILLVALLFLLTLNIHPTRSQDMYWNLTLARGWTVHDMNPYQTSPNMLFGDPWASNVIGWRDQAMTHGIIWMGMLVTAALATAKLATALFIMKLWNLVGITALYILMWRFLKERYANDISRARTFWIFLALQPVWIQYIGIDAHNDVWVALPILASVMLHTRERYSASTFVLILGGMVKYVPLFFLPIPLYYAWKKYPSVKKILRDQLPSIILLGIAAIIFFLFQRPSPELHNQGLWIEFTQRGRIEFSLLGAAFLKWALGASDLVVRIVGTLVGVAVLIRFTLRKRMIQAYVIPIVCILIVGTAWFQTWYVLWIVPLALCIYSPWVVAIAGSALLIMYEVVSPIEMHLVLIIFLMAFYTLRVMRRVFVKFILEQTLRGERRSVLQK